MEITWHGLSCFRMSERGMASIVTDPYDHKSVGLEPLKIKGDIVTVSHDAPGHNFISAVKGSSYLVTGPGEYEVGGVFITGIQTNGRGKRNSDDVRNTLYVFDFDGVTVAHLGDISRVPNQAEVEALGEVHVALVPVGGGSGLNAAKAAEMVSLLEPRIVIPMHYNVRGSSLKLAPVSKFLKEMGLGETPPESSMKVTRSTIPSETRVVVLDYKR